MIKAYVITIETFPKSVRAASRCIMSAADYGLEGVEMWKATIPEDEPKKMLKDRGIPAAGFTEVYSRPERCMSAFLSHHRLWEECAKENDDAYLIFEHDAVMTDELGVIPKMHSRTVPMLCSIGAPSYGKFNTPQKLGVNRLVSKQYLPGAHAYMLNGSAAKALIARAKIDASPTDVFIHNDRFDFLNEMYPYAAIAKDTFTTIQRKQGCLAKHSYGEKYEIL